MIVLHCHNEALASVQNVVKHAVYKKVVSLSYLWLLFFFLSYFQFDKDNKMKYKYSLNHWKRNGSADDTEQNGRHLADNIFKIFF